MAQKDKPEAWTDPKTGKTMVNVGGGHGGQRRPHSLDVLKDAVKSGRTHETTKKHGR